MIFLHNTIKVSKHSLVLLLITFFSTSILSSKAQVNEEGTNAYFKNETLSFGESLSDFGGDLQNSANWTIINEANNQFVQSGNGMTLAQIKFDNPGHYLISFNEQLDHIPGECNHKHLPAGIKLNVSETKMVFDFSNISFSAPVRNGIPTDGIIVSVPIHVKVKNGAPVTFHIPTANVTGIGSEVIATPVQQDIILHDGIFTLQYILSGTAHKDAYLMFDFVDINNQIQSYTQTQPIH